MKLLWLSLALAAPAFAHVTLDVPSAASGSYYKATLKVGHGCDGSPTTSVSVELPEGLRLAHPMPKAGWNVKVEKAAVSPFDNHGTLMKEDVRRITWSGGRLDADFYDEFVFQAKIVAAPGPLPVKVIQLCEKGTLNWVEVAREGQDPHALKGPAPVLNVTPAAATHHH